MYFGIQPQSDVRMVKILYHSVGCHFVLLIMSFALQKIFSFLRSHLLIVNHSVCVIGVLFRKLLPEPMNSRLFPIFSSIRFSVSGVMLKSLIHLDSNLYRVISINLFAFFYMQPSSQTSTICYRCYHFFP